MFKPATNSQFRIPNTVSAISSANISVITLIKGNVMSPYIQKVSVSSNVQSNVAAIHDLGHLSSPTIYLSTTTYNLRH
jgi:hypothetical protein